MFQLRPRDPYGDLPLKGTLSSRGFYGLSLAVVYVPKTASEKGAKYNGALSFRFTTTQLGKEAKS